MLPNYKHLLLLQLIDLRFILKTTVQSSDFWYGKVWFAEDNDLWHEHEEAAIIDIIQSSNLIIVGCIELSFKLILSWTWEMMSWSHYIHLPHIQIKNSIHWNFTWQFGWLLCSDNPQFNWRKEAFGLKEHGIGP